MTTESRLFSLANVERYLFRPVFVFFTFLLVLLAVFQATGRFTLYALELFEDEINVLLDTRQIAVRGLRGDWRGLNPVLRAEQVTFPAGSVAGVEVELDVLESILRNAPVTRFARVESADVHVEQTDSGWRLRGMTGQNDFDVTPLLRHSDDLHGSVRLHLHDAQDRSSTLAAELGLINRGGLHYAHATLVNAGAPADALELQLWQREDVFLVQDASNIARVEGAVVLPEVLTRLPALRLGFTNTAWHDEDGLGSGALNVALTGLQLPGADHPLAATVSAAGERRERAVRVVSTPLRVSVADDALELGPIYADVELPASMSRLEAAADLLTPTAPKPMVSAWLERVQLGAVSEFFVAHLGEWEPAGRWVRALAVAGEASNIHGFFDPEMGFGYQASIADLQMQGYKGAPTLRNVQGRLWGHQHTIAMQVNSTGVTMQFPDQFNEAWPVDDVQGVVKAWIGGGYFGMRGSHLKARIEDSNVGGSFALTRPRERSEQRLSLHLHVDAVGLTRARTFVPYKLPQALSDWLARGPRAADLSAARFAMHGPTAPGSVRRIELRAQLTDGRVEYDPAWPEVYAVNGDVHVAGTDTRINVTSGRTGEVQLTGAELVLRDNGRYASGSIEARGEAGALLNFVRTSALRDNLPFVTPQWEGAGGMNLRGNLVIPISAERQPPPLRVDLQFYLDGVDLSMPEYRISVADMRGSGTFSLPHNLSGEFTGSLFDREASVRAHYDPQWLRFDIEGSATPRDVYAMLDTENEVPISGKFDFDSVLSIGMAGGVTNLALSTDLVGLDVALPGRFAKPADVASPSEVDVQFLADYESVGYRYQDVTGWLHYGDGIERGALGIGTQAPMTAVDKRAVVIGGRLEQLALSDWVSDKGDSAVSLPLDWTIKGLTVDRFNVNDVVFENLALTGSQSGEDVEFGFHAQDIIGSVALPEEGNMVIDLEYLKLPDPDTGLDDHIGAPQEDPIGVEVGRSLPAANVKIARLDIGEEPFGSWEFVIAPSADAVDFESFSADVNGVHIVDGKLQWKLDDDLSTFRGEIQLDDLATTLPKWGYAASLTSDEAKLKADVAWGGSPVNVSLLGAAGRVEFSAKDGRFIEVESGGGGLRILGLLNFTKVAKRISFDFSDVVGEGISFEKIDAEVDLDEGLLTFPARMTVDSSSGNFQVGGRVNLHSGKLDNEMIVTLPVSKSLPWYGVYLALANPLAGLGVMVGERVLRKPIEQFSTAKFEVTGTLDDPKVTFVSLWDQSMTEPGSDAVEDVPGGELEDSPTALVEPSEQTDLAGDPSLVKSE